MSLRRILGLAVLLGAQVCVSRAGAAEAKNLFANPSFEMGTDPWRLDKGGKTVASLKLDPESAFAGDRGALVTIETVDQWGTQFGQSVDAGQKGKTYTFAVFARSTKGPVAVDLQIERPADPWDRAARSDRFTLKPDEWTELHVTFKVSTDFPQGWFAYISCTQPNAQYRADVFRLYEGDYTPYKEAAKQEAASAAVRLFDTGTRASEPLAPDALSRRAGWTALAEDDVKHTFKGDVVFLNNALAVVLRQKGRGAELYSISPKGAKMRAVLAPVSDAPAGQLKSVKIAENNPGRAVVEATFGAAGGKNATLAYDLRMGQAFVKTEPRSGAAGLRVEAPCRFVVMPDFFADDIVVQASEIPVAKAELPSENFLLHLLGEGDAIVMSVWNSAQEDVRVELSGDGPDRAVRVSEMRYGKDGKLWVAAMEGQGIWHTRDVASEDTNKIIRLDWKAPYAAQWRVDWRRDDNLTDSWEMITEKPNGQYEKHGWFGQPESFGNADWMKPDRKRWTTVLGSFSYPCWTDRAGQGFLQPLKQKVRFQGPAVIYPINRVNATPLDRFTVVDIVRGTLGVGPCEYILDVEGQQKSYKGKATCATRDKLNGIYSAKQQKQRKAEVEQALVDVMAFIRHIRGRIEDYVAFGHEMMTYLDDQKKAHPELTPRIAELEKLTQAIDARKANRKDSIKTPEYAASLAEEFRKTLIDYEGDDALAKCKKFTEAWVEIGGNQDELVGECRAAVKVLRQRAGLLMAVDPQMAGVAREVRVRTQKMLRNPTSYEAPRH